MGEVTGLFVTTREFMRKRVGKHVDFGEALGKHSQIDGELSEQDCVIVCEDQDFIAKLVKFIGSENISGYNPFDYMEG